MNANEKEIFEKISTRGRKDDADEVNQSYYSKHGSLEFQSDGGLLEVCTNALKPAEVEFSTVKAKHINVVDLGGEAVAAMYYLEGSTKIKNGPMISNYRGRATEVFVKEDGEWRARLGHWSALKGGSVLEERFNEYE